MSVSPQHTPGGGGGGDGSDSRNARGFSKQFTTVEQLLLRGISAPEIREICRIKFGMTPLMVQRMTARVLAVWEASGASTPERRVENRNRALRRAAMCEKQNQYSAMARYDELIAKIDGSIAPLEANVNVNAVPPSLLAKFEASARRIMNSFRAALEKHLPDPELRDLVLTSMHQINEEAAAREQPIADHLKLLVAGATVAQVIDDGEDIDDQADDDSDPGA